MKKKKSEERGSIYVSVCSRMLVPEFLILPWSNGASQFPLCVLEQLSNSIFQSFAWEWECGGGSKPPEYNSDWK
jgi:hypothetical protein